MNGGHPPEHDDTQQPTSAVRDPDDAPERPDAKDCPWCPGERTLETRLEAGLSAFGSTRRPTVVHVTECSACGAERRVAVDVDALGDDTDAVDGGMWNNYPGQGSLEDHQ